jgi:hypothetical protein
LCHAGEETETCTPRTVSSKHKKEDSMQLGLLSESFA